MGGDGPVAAECEREFTLTDRDYQCISVLARQHTGICLSNAKRDMVYSRLSRRLRRLGLRDFAAYCALLAGDDSGAEVAEFTNAITTNLTSFFREAHHFEHMEKALLPALLETRRTKRRLRFWSAGCSTGEEPYSMAMILAETVPAGWDVKVLATDLDSNVLETARRGVYDATRVKGVSRDRLGRWLRQGRGESAGQVRVAERLRELVAFKQLNLMGSWPMHGPFDAIFCRNVMIYFDKATQKTIVERYADLLAADGQLFLGHSETLYRVTERLEHIGQTIYRKCI